ncbi:MAG: AI-2E family transporter [Candidatus Colwellbacteria bacterium]|nr:AI-2E family transporter [Candidatus Colwellbacteria bacterium]
MAEKQHTLIEISWGSLWRILMMAGFVIVLYLTRETVAILLLALIISTAFEPAVARMQKWRIPRLLGTIIVFLIFLTILAFVVYAIFPIALLELNSLFKNLSGLANQFLGIETPAEVINLIGPDLTNVSNVLLSGGVPFLAILGRLLGGVAFALAVLVLSFYLTVSRDGVEKFLRAVFPETMEDRVLQLYRRTRRRIGRWFQAQIVLSLVVGFMVFIGLWILGVEQRLVLAIIAALFELVPVVGPIFAGALAVAIALADSVSLGLYVLLLFLGIQQLENQVLVPLVMRRALGIHPVIILVALLGGVQIAGILGMLVAIPVTVFLQEVVEDWMRIKSRRSRARLTV